MDSLHPRAQKLLQKFRGNYIPNENTHLISSYRRVYEALINVNGPSMDVYRDCIKVCDQALKEVRLRKLLRNN